VIEYSLEYYNNIVILDSQEIIKLTDIETQLYCESLGIEYNIKNRDIKNLYYNFYLLRIFNFITKDSRSRHVIIFIDSAIKLHSFQNSLLKKTPSLLPINTIYYTDRVTDFINKVNLRCADTVVAIDSLKKIDVLNNSFRKLKKFLKDNKLQYLDNQYLNSVKVKFSLLSGIQV
jgi:hypothetical protein